LAWKIQFFGRVGQLATDPSSLDFSVERSEYMLVLTYKVLY